MMDGMGWTIPNPCSKRFADMAGDERRRFCETCGTHVHSVELYSEAELAAMGPICGYSGGTTEGPRQGRRALLAGALLTTIAPLLAQEGQFVIAVKDAKGAGVPYAEVTVGSRKVLADEAGVANISGLPVGRQEVQVASRGFRIWRGAYTITNHEPRRVAAVLEVGSVGIVEYVQPKARGGAPGRVSLSVRDGSGGVIAGAEVVVVSASGATRHSRTDDDGHAVVSDVEPGEVKVSVERDGFSVWRAKRGVNGGGELRLEVSLILRGQDVKVDVKESAGRRFWNWLSSCTRK